MSTILQLIYSMIIGVIQGVSEWLPISSKTQIIVSSSYLLKLTFQQAYTFGLFLEIGTVIAAVAYFRKDLIEMIRVLLGSKDKAHRRLLIYVLVVTIITGIIAVPLYLVADSISGIAVGIPMLIIGIVLIVDAVVIRYSRKKREKGMNSRKLENLTIRDYVLIGIAQGIAALPGVSRSGNYYQRHASYERGTRRGFQIIIYCRHLRRNWGFWTNSSLNHVKCIRRRSRNWVTRPRYCNYCFRSCKFVFD